MFESTTESATVQEMKLCGNFLGDGGSEQLQLLDEEGNPGATYVYVKGEWLGEGAEDAWCDGGSLKPVTTIELKQGKGFYIKSSSKDDEIKVQTSGSVKLANTEVSLPGGYTIVGNASPVNLDIQRFKLSGSYLGDGGSEQLQLLDEEGNPGATYVYVKGEWLGEGAEDAWCDGGSLKPITLSVKAGEGLYLKTGDGVTFITPSPIR